MSWRRHRSGLLVPAGGAARTAHATTYRGIDNATSTSSHTVTSASIGAAAGANEEKWLCVAVLTQDDTALSTPTGVTFASNSMTQVSGCAATQTDATGDIACDFYIRQEDAATSGNIVASHDVAADDSIIIWWTILTPTGFAGGTHQTQTATDNGGNIACNFSSTLGQTNGSYFYACVDNLSGEDTTANPVAGGAGATHTQDIGGDYGGTTVQAGRADISTGWSSGNQHQCQFGAGGAAAGFYCAFLATT